MKSHSLPNKAIIIVGRISSGKSTLAKLISEKFEVSIASFGGYLKDYCSKNNLQTDRKTLQDIGEKLIMENPDLFLANVLKYSKAVDRVIIEGVRHKVILNSIKQSCQSRFTIFLAVPYQIRYERFLLRNKESDSMSKSELDFRRVNEHPVELEIETLMSDCDIHTSSFDDDLNSRLAQFLKF
jgi:cytidylate kinase